MAAVLLAGCAPGGAAPAGAPVADPAQLAADLANATTPSGPRQISFRWSLNEAGSRVGGRGVVREAAPDRLRLDLFGPRNETYLSASLVDGEFHMPGAATEKVPLPSAALFWGGLGLVSPPAGTDLHGATTTDSVAVLRYDAANGDVFQYRVQLRNGSPLLEKVERIGPSGVLETVELEHNDAGDLLTTHYRDWSAYRDLTLDVEKIEDVASFPKSIWTP